MGGSDQTQKATQEQATSKESADVDAEDIYEELRLPADVYACAYVLGNNASPTMYSFWPWKNKQMLLVWLYLIFIITSQLIALVALTILDPPVANERTLLVNCALSESENFRIAGQPQYLNFSAEAECITKLDSIAFEAEIGGKLVAYRSAQLEQAFMYNTFRGDWLHTLLQVICCVWVLTHVYLNNFANVTNLFAYRDFCYYFLPLKGEEVVNHWVVILPLTQWALSTAVISVSWCLLSSYESSTDVVLNSMAFTFVNEIAEVFAEPLIEHYSTTAITGLDVKEYGAEPIYYIVNEYDEDNAGDPGWYIKLCEKEKCGLVTDFRYRLNKNKYPNFGTPTVELLRRMLFGIPTISLLACILSTTGHLKAPLKFVFAVALVCCCYIVFIEISAVRVACKHQRVTVAEYKNNMERKQAEKLAAATVTTTSRTTTPTTPTPTPATTTTPTPTPQTPTPSSSPTRPTIIVNKDREQKVFNQRRKSTSTSTPTTASTPTTTSTTFAPTPMTLRSVGRHHRLVRQRSQKLTTSV